MLPTADNPLILVYPGKVPSMKNQTQIYLKDSPAEGETVGGRVVAGVGRPASVQRYLGMMSDRAVSQMQNQKFSKIELPFRVLCWATIGIYKSPTNKDSTFIPKNDVDNMYTTIQETWKNSIMVDDRQVVDYHVSSRLFTNEKTMYTCVFLWTVDLDNSNNTTEHVKSFMTVFDTFGNKPVWSIFNERLNHHE